MARQAMHRELPRTFWKRVFRDPDSECWEVHGCKGVGGYARMWDKTRKMYGLAHRISYEAFVGPIPLGMQIDHLCRNPGCANPDHLEAVTARENTLRSEAPSAYMARRSHCPQGHPFYGENLYEQPDGARICKTCRRARQARWSKERRRVAYSRA